jgi:hypothetical protein
MVKRDTYRAGCFNSGPAAEGYYAMDRMYYPDGKWSIKLVWVPHVMSKNCRQIYTLPECVDCTAIKDTDYINRMKGLK